MKRLGDLMFECGTACMAIGSSAVEAMVAGGIPRDTAEDVIVHAMLVGYSAGRLAQANETVARYAAKKGAL